MSPSTRLRAISAAIALTSLSVVAVGSASSSAAATRVKRTAQVSATQVSPAGTPICGGEVVYNADGTAKTCSFDDEFDATTGDASALDTTKWIPQLTANSAFTTGPAGSYACYVNTPSTISVGGGYLNLSATRSSNAFVCKSPAVSYTTRYNAGMVTTYGLFTQTYGQFEVRAKLPTTTVRGLQSTLWLYPQNAKYYGSWPASGEIDFAEFYSQYPNNNIPYIHYNYTKTTASGTTNQVTSYKCTINYGQFNTYGAIWKPGELTLLVNGHVCLTDDYLPNNGLVSPQPFDQPFMIALTQALGVGTNAVNSSTPFPATTQIDYVRAWK